MRKVRLFIEDNRLVTGALISCDKKQSHYLTHVMRMGDGEHLAVFNGIDGLWRAELQVESKKKCILEIKDLLQAQKKSPDIHLCFAPLKQTPQHFLIEKATELGATHFHPVLTERTVVRQFKTDKNRLTILEACEQCERLDVPAVSELQSLDALLSSLDPKVDCVYVCDERREAPALIAAYDPDKTLYILIGPEGGFSPAEFEKLQRHRATAFMRLSSHILRAETAAVAVMGQVALLKDH